MLIDANDIGRARDVTGEEILAAGGAEEWYREQGFVPEDVRTVLSDATQAVLALNQDPDISPEDLIFSAISMGLSIGWALHRDQVTT